MIDDRYNKRASYALRGRPAESTCCRRRVRAYIHAAIAPRARQAYREDLARFLAWGGRIPSPLEGVAAYLVVHPT